MERTGHHSTDGIGVYKRTNSEQQEQISDILLRSKKFKPKADTSTLHVCSFYYQQHYINFWINWVNLRDALTITAKNGGEPTAYV